MNQHSSSASFRDWVSRFVYPPWKTELIPIPSSPTAIADKMADDILHDLKEAARTEPDFPENFERFRHFRNYLLESGLWDPMAMLGVPIVWQRYQRWLNEQQG